MAYLVSPRRSLPYEVFDVHTQLQFLDPLLRADDLTSVARLGDDGTIVGRVITQRLLAPDQPAGPENPETDFVIVPG